MPLVFVYGTLMRAGANHAVLERLGATFITNGTTHEPRTLVDLGPYPALLPARDVRDEEQLTSAVLVAGEVWEIDDRALRELDAFEGYPDLYGREHIAVDGDDGEPRRSFVYVLARRPPAHARVIATGRYVGSGTVLPEGATAEQIDDPDPKSDR
jgi:gamma-glutamylaminecyclotransferase